MNRIGFSKAEMGAKLRQIRRARELTLDEVARRMGLAGKGRHNLMIRLETNRVTPRVPNLVTELMPKEVISEVTPWTRSTPSINSG